MVINGYEVDIEYLTSDIYGLINIPNMKKYDNTADSCSFTQSKPVEVSKQSYDLVDDLCSKYMTHGIMEIGICRNGEGSFTHALLNNKPNEIPYLGVDVDDKTHLNDIEKNIYTIQTKSEEQIKIREYMKSIGMEKLSILFIDGWHSVDAVINDWRYADLLSDNSIVFFHDTYSHPGPAIILESIDTGIFEIKKYFHSKEDRDYGISTAVKIKS